MKVIRISGGSIALTVLIMNFFIGGIWGITMYLSDYDEAQFSEPNYTYNLSDEEKEKLKEEAYKSSQYDYNLPPILNGLLISYLALSSIVAGYVVFFPTK